MKQILSYNKLAFFITDHYIASKNMKTHTNVGRRNIVPRHGFAMFSHYRAKVFVVRRIQKSHVIISLGFAVHNNMSTGD